MQALTLQCPASNTREPHERQLLDNVVGVARHAMSDRAPYPKVHRLRKHDRSEVDTIS